MTALVGPLPTIRFQDGTRIAYTPPPHTLDIRYAVCTDHHPACDCREAELAENAGELRGELDGIKAAFATELQDHATWPAWTGDPDASFNVCSCTGCLIARRIRFIRDSHDTERERRACRPSPPSPQQQEDVPF